MDIKKTVVLSVFLHICFFSAALLLFEGNGKLSETEVVFITLVADEPWVVEAEAVPARVRVVKKTERPPVIARKEQEILAAEVVVEKIEDNAPEEFVPVINEPVSAELVADESKGDINDHSEEAEVVQAVHDPPAPGNQMSVLAEQGIGLLPGTIDLISMAIERVKTYPILARRRGIEGTVHISFNIMADGNPHGIKILKSSGFSILDKATVKVVEKAAPFPLIASRIELPVAYRLRN